MRFPLLKESHLARFHTKDDVIQHGKYFDELEVLVYHANIQGVRVVGIFDMDDFAVLLDDAAFQLIQAEQHAHERRFSCAVLAEQGMDFPAP
ncbi:hypothetical protein SDC9_96816 [bioreactor metagenome]|uniref:Uncharacterized protein n=1 Tax=bioreactor metagenome TaxID=1076179 RepID=A0A645ACS2_9ZZZZ